MRRFKYGYPLPPEKRERWQSRPGYLDANDGAAMCNLTWGKENDVQVICALGGIGCNVDHFWILRERQATREGLWRSGSPTSGP